MRYQIKQKVFSFGDSFTIKDDKGNDRYIVKGKVFSFGNKLRMYNMKGQELVYIEQKIFRFLSEYNIYFKDLLYATVKKEFSFFRPRFNVVSHMGGYSVQGDFWGLDFSIYREGKHVAQVSKKWISWGDSYGVDIVEGEDDPFILTLVIVIDQVLHNSSSNNSSS